MKDLVKVSFLIVTCFGLAIIAGHVAGYGIMFLDEWEVDRTIFWKQ